MKRIFGMVALVLAFSIPARAQGGAGGNTKTNGGGAFASGGAAASSRPPYTPTAQFKTAAASGSSAEYVPSAYVPFEQAVALAQKASNAPKPVSVAEVAQEYRSNKGQTSGVVIVQGANGELVGISR